LAKTRPIEPVIRFVAIITSLPEVARWARIRIADAWGEVAETSAPMPFVAGGYYDDEMGRGLSKVLVAMAKPCDSGTLADWKRQTNEWEWQAAAEYGGGPARPLNLDPGYVTQAKLVLATVKDRDHRIYLRDGIFAEVTLTYTGGQWIGHRWTYPDYRTPEVIDFANRCRHRLREHLKAIGGFRTARKHSFLQPDRGSGVSNSGEGLTE
jgi:hypothetical protein